MAIRRHKMYRMEVRVGKAWVPATPELVPSNEVATFRERFKAARPGAELRAVPADGSGRVR